MKLWIDDIRPAPEGYYWIKSVDQAIRVISKYSNWLDNNMQGIDLIELIDLDHDAGVYAHFGGD